MLGSVVQSVAYLRVRADLEKSLNLTLVLENFWNLKKVPLSWNCSGIL